MIMNSQGNLHEVSLSDPITIRVALTEEQCALLQDPRAVAFVEQSISKTLDAEWRRLFIDSFINGVEVIR